MNADIGYRRATSADLAATYDVFIAAADDLRARAHRPPVDDTAERRARAMPFRRHALLHDPDGIWVAEAEGAVIGFGIATRRGRLWYLAALHVVPAYQARGVGGELLRRCLATGAAPGVVRTVISESSQPISNALYAKHGMYQWVPIVHVEGSIRSLPAPPSGGLTAEAVRADDGALATLDAIDTAVLGATRAIDHRLWLDQPGLAGLLFSRGGRAIGYAYASASGKIGPVAILSARDVPAALALGIRSAAERGAEQATFVVPGHCRSALAYLLAGGFRYGESINLLLSSRPFGHLDRYLISAGDALF